MKNPFIHIVKTTAVALAVALPGIMTARCGTGDSDNAATVADSLATDSISVQGAFHSGPLNDDDIREIADELNVEPAVIKAVVAVETGATHRGLYAEGKPIINFDLAVFRRNAARRKINLNKYTRTHPVVFARPDIRRYGSQQAAQRARFDQAASIDSTAAIESTFWGMFQIGGFNWKLCGASSHSEFVELMSRSEHDQLQLFANFVTNTGLLKYLKAKNWSGFARHYNGKGYAAKGYHTKLAAAYKKAKKQLESAATDSCRE